MLHHRAPRTRRFGLNLISSDSFIFFNEDPDSSMRSEAVNADAVVTTIFSAEDDFMLLVVYRCVVDGVNDEAVASTTATDAFDFGGDDFAGV